MRWDDMADDAIRSAERAERAAWLDEFTTPAGPEQYAAWLRLWVKQGEDISHRYDYDLPSTFVVLTREVDFWPRGWYGAQSIDLIIPAELAHVASRIPRTFHGGWGHSNVYLFTEDGAKRIGTEVPVYRNARGVTVR